jgi:methionyl-tRNA synthetase
MQPTPNGRLHLGHVAGPYLRADVTARLLRRHGADVSLICGADVFENWILLPALIHDVAPEVLCRQNSDLIQRDLLSMQIAIDRWVNPLSLSDAEPYAALHNKLLELGIQSGSLEAKAERIPFAQHSGRAIVGVWLLGRCPGCGLPAGGNCCENCGFHYQPDEIVDPRSRVEDEHLVWRETTTWFTAGADRSAIAKAIANMADEQVFRELASRYIASTSCSVRLTMPGEWGVENRVDQNGALVCNSFFAYCVYCGELFARRTGLTNPFYGTGSETRVIAFAGIDNLVAALIAPAVLSKAIPGLRYFDKVILNKFLLLEGSKFSTSRHHAIWVDEIVGSGHVSVDEIRLFLASISPTPAESNFELLQFVHFVNGHRERLASSLELGDKPYRADITEGEVESALSTRGIDFEAFDPEAVNLKDLFQIYWSWLENREAMLCDPSLWKRALAFLVDPLAPILSRELTDVTTPIPDGILSRLTDRVSLKDLGDIVHLQQEPK